ncbi:ATP-binding protein [Embleya sp. NBC_00896]|uniref:sensor histidine kinase n=1 Tax=Embleya sp. NBC_00896 TaxID=2975961 RepID=UPI00386B92D3|nr:CHASE3 domain-containing protein [Embleya sp. NBC_00896]
MTGIETRTKRRRGPRMRQVVGLALGLLALVIVISAAVGAFAISRLNDSRDTVLDRLEPAANTSLRLENALIDQETGVRGRLISGDPSFREPYTVGRAEEDRAYTRLDELLPSSAEGDRLRADLADVRAKAQAWRSSYAEPALAQGRSDPDSLLSDQGKGLFDALRQAITNQQTHLNDARLAARAELAEDARMLTATLISVAVLFAGLLVVVGLLFRRMVTQPLEHLGEQVRRVTKGDYGHELTGRGPAEITALTHDVNSMRDRIVEELRSTEAARVLVDEQAEDLRRSNAELEQFAYVASHDLQEPLRKVASFCQLLEKRYKGQLDERADQYIAFAVDGAKRMQTLINDLLTFSRVGRLDTERGDVDLGRCLDHALHALAAAREESDAEVTADPLPTVVGDALLLGQLVQNLVGNAIKFRAEAVPRVHLGARWDGEQWEFSCTDNGIGIESQYADRIFVIFQRLHPKDAYAGTGIGLAMCKKIVEYHGGRIWLDPDTESGTTIRWTLPGPPPKDPPATAAAEPHDSVPPPAEAVVELPAR